MPDRTANFSQVCPIARSERHSIPHVPVQQRSGLSEYPRFPPRHSTRARPSISPLPAVDVPLLLTSVESEVGYSFRSFWILGRGLR